MLALAVVLTVVEVVVVAAAGAAGAALESAAAWSAANPLRRGLDELTSPGEGVLCRDAFEKVV